MIYILLGLKCAGKTTLRKYAETKYGMETFEASDYIKSAKEVLGITSTAELLSKVGMDYAACEIIKKIPKGDSRNIVISGFRTCEEVATIKKHFSDVKVIYIETDVLKCYQRAHNRNRDKSDRDYTAFLTARENDAKLGIETHKAEIVDIIIKGDNKEIMNKEFDKLNKENSVYRECELKFQVNNAQEKSALIEKLLKQGYKLVEEKTESDFTPDVKGFLCRENGLMFRVRQSKTIDDNKIVFTLKIKGGSKNFQDNYELETATDKPNGKQANQINVAINKVANVTIPNEIFKEDNLAKVVTDLTELGFTEHRMFTQKRRSEYVGKKAKVTFDQFPKNIGTYMEIETGNENDLFATVNSLGLNKDKAEKRNYGEIIKDAQKDLPEIERRTCLFDETMLAQIRKIQNKNEGVKYKI